MKNKFLIITIILIIISIPVFLQISNTVVIIDNSSNIFIIGAYVVLIVATLIFFSISIKKIESKKPTETIRIIRKSSEDENDTKSTKRVNKKDEEDARYVAKMIKEIIANLSELKDVKKITEQILKNLSKTYNIVQGVSFILDKETNSFKTSGTYAFYTNELYREFKEGEGLTGQVVKNKEFLYIDNVPDNYITILSGLGEGTPKYLILFPIIFENKVIGIIEFATFSQLPRDSEKIFNKLRTVIGEIINGLVS